MARLIVVAICIVGLVGWGLALAPEFRSDSNDTPTATEVGGNPSPSKTPVSTAASTGETPPPTRRPARTAPPTLPIDGNQTPRPTRTPT
jgi:hypothetical protein